MTKTTKKKTIKALATSFVALVGVTSLATVLSSCVGLGDDKLPNIIPPTLVPSKPTEGTDTVNPSQPSETPKSKLLFSDTNDINSLKSYTNPTITPLNNAVMNDAYGQPVLVSKEFIEQQPEYINKIQTLNQDQTLFENIMKGFANDYINSTIKKFQIEKRDVITNVNSDFNNKFVKIAIQFSNNKKTSIQSDSIILRPGEYYATLINLDFKNAKFQLNNNNQLVVVDTKIDAQNDVNGTVGQWDATNTFNINNNEKLFNAVAQNATNETSPTQATNDWLLSNFNSELSSQKILSDTEKTINDQLLLTQKIVLNSQKIGELLATNPDIRTFLTSIGEPIAAILELFDSTKPYANLVRDCFSLEGNNATLRNDLDQLSKSITLSPTIKMAIDFVINSLNEKIFVDWILSFSYEILHGLINFVINKLPTSLSSIVSVIDTYFGLVNQLAISKNQKIEQLKILDVLTDESIKKEVPNLLNKILPLVPERQKKIIGLVVNLWAEISPNWTTVNLQGLLKNIFEPKVNLTTGATPTKLSDVASKYIKITALPNSSATLNQDKQTFTINQKFSINFTENISWDLTSLKEIFKSVTTTTLLKLLNVDMSSWGKLVDALGTIGKLLPNTFEIVKDEGVNVTFNDNNAILRPNESGYQLISNQYVSVNFKQSFQKFVDGAKSNLVWWAKPLAGLILPSYINPIKDYYMGYQFAINSPLQINDLKLKLKVNNVYDGTNKFNIDNALMTELKKTTIPNFIKSSIEKVTDKKEMTLNPTKELKTSILSALNLKDSNNIHIEIFLTPAYDQKATTNHAPIMSNAWVVVQLDKPYLDTTNQAKPYWTKSIVIDNLDLPTINNQSPAVTPAQ